MEKFLLILLGLSPAIVFSKQIELVTIPLSVEMNNPEYIKENTLTIDIPDNDLSLSGGEIGEENRKSALENFKKKYSEKFDEDGNYKSSLHLKSSPKIGMSEDEVLKSTWGKPFSKRSTESKYGISETWYYKSLGSIKIFNGKVEYIHRND